MKKHNEALNFPIVEESILDILLKNLDSSFACEIRKLWIDPSAFTVENFLGKGIRLKFCHYIFGIKILEQPLKTC